MALYRQIFIEFWKDPKVTEEMSAEDRYTLLYLLTNPHTTQIGIYQITKRQMAFDLGYSTESVGAILERFEKLLGIIKYNPDTREIALKNWGRYNLKRGGKPIMDCIRGELEKVKDKKLIEYVAENIPNETIKNEFLRNVNDTFNVTSTYSGQEEEQEKEQEKEKEEEQPPRNDTLNLVVVIETIKKYFDLEEKDIKRVANTFLATHKEIDYLVEKLEYVKNNPNTRDVIGLLIASLKNDYKTSININPAYMPNKFANFEQPFMKYSETELDEIIARSQREKFN